MSCRIQMSYNDGPCVGKNSQLDTCTISSLSFFDLLPFEAMTNIFGNLNLVEQCRLRRVCKGWEFVLKSAPIQRHVVLVLNTLQHLHRYSGVPRELGLSFQEQKYMACMKSIGPNLSRLTIVGFCGRTKPGSYAVRHQQHGWIVITAIESVKKRASLDVTFINGQFSNRDLHQLLRPAVRSFSCSNWDLLIRFPENQLVFVRFKVECRVSIEFCSCADFKRKVASLEAWLWKIAEEHGDGHAEYSKFLIGQWKTCYGLHRWAHVKRIIQAREVAYKSGVPGHIHPDLFSFLTLKPMTRIQIGCYLDSWGALK